MGQLIYDEGRRDTIKEVQKKLLKYINENKCDFLRNSGYRKIKETIILLGGAK